MDPDANLAEQEALILANRADYIAIGMGEPVPPVVVRTERNTRKRELRNALTSWLLLGGAEPDWSVAPNARIYFRK